MADLAVTVGSCTAQGRRPNNEDRLATGAGLFLVADGMGGQDCGEEASGMAVEVIPRAVASGLASGDAEAAIREGIIQAHRAILDAGKRMPSTRRMGTTAVLAVHVRDQVFVAAIGDSPAFLVRGGTARQLTEDHTIADALARRGTITHEQARQSPYRNVLYKFLGCAEWTDGVEVRPFSPEHGDRLVLASDGLSGILNEPEIAQTVRLHPEPQPCADALVRLSLERGSKDNVTCIVVAFEAVNHTRPPGVSPS